MTTKPDPFRYAPYYPTQSVLRHQADEMKKRVDASRQVPKLQLVRPAAKAAKPAAPARPAAPAPVRPASDPAPKPDEVTMSRPEFKALMKAANLGIAAAEGRIR